jgi:BirA family biotin operon repressor/biotin-[acetyl-CoA-carboxylase] ligase
MTCDPRLPPVYKLIALDEVDSTNAEAKRRATDGAVDGTLVWARSQSAGRGRRGRSWESPPGNLYCSLILRPDCRLAEATQLCFVAALAVYDAVGSVGVAGLEAWCKWPNDVLLGAGKIAGILLECETGERAAPAWVVLGVGVNVASYPEDTEQPATSLHAEGSPEATVVDMLEAFSRHFQVWSRRWLDDGFAAVHEVWLARAKGLGEPIRVRLANQTLDGTFAGLDGDGALILETGGATRRITSGEVFLGAA